MEEMPASSGGSWKRSRKKGHFEAEKLELAEENAAFYGERLPLGLGLQGAYVKFLEWSDAEKAKKSKCWKWKRKSWKTKRKSCWI
jgi:hypothetical protein